MIPFDGIRGQEQAVSFLRAALESGRVAHAYLFSGPSGTGKLSMALDLAAAWMCPADDHGFCAECSHCTRIRTFEHPDVRMTIPRTASVTPEQEMELLVTRGSDLTSPLSFGGNTSIRIQQVRELQRRMMLKPFEGHGRVEIVVDADRMTLPAANALLKTLEEPPDGTLIVLLTTVYTRILPTIRSRAHLLRLCRIPKESIAEILTERRKADPETARTIAAGADGSIGRALLIFDCGSEEGESESGVVLKTLSGCTSASEVSSLASGLAKELGRDGLLVLCRETRALTHDRRRMGNLRSSLGIDPPQDVLGNLGDLSLGCIEGVFRECEARLGGNVMPSIALHAALTRCWREITQGGARS